MSFRKSLLWFFVIFSFAWLLVEHLWISLPASGRVTDSSGKPVPGAVVMAAWTLKWGRAGTHGFILRESKTDVLGRFEIPAWIRLSPVLFARMDIGPHVYALADGYMPVVVRAHLDEHFVNATPEVIGTIKLQHIVMEGRQAINQELIDSYSTALCIYWHPDSSRIWGDVPNFVAMMAVLQKQLGGDPSRFPCEFVING